MSDVLVGPPRYADLCPLGRTLLLESGLNLEENPHSQPFTKSELLASAPNIRAAIVGVEMWDADVISAARNLRVLTKLGVGVDNIDLGAAAARGITVCNAPGGNANAVAEMTIGLIIAVMRQIPVLDAQTRAGSWTRIVGSELSGKTVGFIGFGTIGQMVARRLSGFDCELVAYDPHPNLEAAAQLSVTMATLENALSRSDVISLHMPSLPSTRNMIDRAFLAHAKSGALVVNTARGALIDEIALATALRSGDLSGAALDVFSVEPVPTDNPLLTLPHVIVTSHAAADTYEAYETIGVLNARAILAVLAGQHPANTVA